HERTAVQVLETLNVPLLGRPQALEQVDERALRVVAGGEGATDGSDLHRSPKSGRMVRVLICRLVAQLLPIGRPDAPSYPRAHSTYHDRVPAAWEGALAGWRRRGGVGGRCGVARRPPGRKERGGVEKDETGGRGKCRERPRRHNGGDVDAELPPQREIGQQEGRVAGGDGGSDEED